MVGMIYLIVAAVGFALLVLTLVLGELFDVAEDLDFGPDVDADFDADYDGDSSSPSLLSGRVLAAGAVGFGGFGYIATDFDVPLLLSLVAAVVGFYAVAAGTLYGVLKPLARQQSNSMLGGHSYIGLTATVMVSIPPNGSGAVSFADANGATTRRQAWSQDQEELKRGASVRITQVTSEGVIVTPATRSSELQPNSD